MTLRMAKNTGLTKRQKTIIKMLTGFTSENPVTVQAISDKLKLSSRTVLRELPQIDTWFLENDFHLVKKPRIGLYVDEDQQTRDFLKELVDMDQNKPEYTKEERQNLILLELLANQEPLKYFYFTSQFHISDGTLSNDLDEIEKRMADYNIQICRKPGIGVYWKAKEEDYRQAVIVYLKGSSKCSSLQMLLEDSNPIKNLFFPGLCQEVLDEIQMIIRETQNVLDICYTENSQFHLSLYLLFAEQRIKDGYEVQSESKFLESMMHLPEYQVANWIGSKLGIMTGRDVSEGETYCACMLLLSAKIWKIKDDSKYEESNFKIRQIVIKIVLNMEKLLETDLLDNQILIDGLCNHMRPAINRMKMNVFSENGHLEVLKGKYPDIYQNTIVACTFLKEELNLEEIPEGELGFIAMYFCVVMEKKYTEEEKVSVIVACPNGVGTSHMLSVHLQKEFPEIRVQRIVSTTKLDPKLLEKEGIDLIISTAELTIDFPYIFVNSVLLEQDRFLIRDTLKKIHRHKNVHQIKPVKKKRKVRRSEIFHVALLGSEILQVLDNIKISTEDCLESKEDLIVKAGQLFARNGEMEEIIARDLAKRENISSTFIPSRNMLFLHCETKGVRHCRFGYISLRKPIKDKKDIILGAIVMLIPKEGQRAYREVMSEISGALAEKEQIMTYLYHKNRKAAEIELENSLGNYYKKVMNSH